MLKAKKSNDRRVSQGQEMDSDDDKDHYKDSDDDNDDNDDFVLAS